MLLESAEKKRKKMKENKRREMKEEIKNITKTFQPGLGSSSKRGKWKNLESEKITSR